MENSSVQNRPAQGYRIHWHVLFTHFPLSLFGTAFGFQILHLFFAPACFELATNVTLMAGAAMVFPTIWTGRMEWTSHFHRAKALIFRRKIAISYFLIALSLPLAIWRIAFLGLFEEASMGPSHWIYLAGNSLLIIGALAEGYYGGRLNHR